jgi:hypothetical protein
MFLVLGASASLSALLPNATPASWLPGLQGLAVAANLLSLWSQHEVAQSLFEATLARTPLPAAAANVFGGVVTASRLMAAVVTLVACACPAGSCAG